MRRSAMPLLTFVLGFLVLHIIERAAGAYRGHESEYAGHHHAPTVGVLAASGLVGHSLMDGFAIGTGRSLSWPSTRSRPSSVRRSRSRSRSRTPSSGCTWGSSAAS
jgi:hypothetical protein